MVAKKIIPPFLNKGDEVAVISPSFAVDEEKVMVAISFIESWGLKVRLGSNALKKNGPFAGSDAERLSDLQEMTNDNKTKAVFFSRGGYGMLKIIDKVDFSVLKKNPKWYVGFSDITVLHLWLNKNFNMVTIHGEMPVNYSNSLKSAMTYSSLHGTLFGVPEDIIWESSCLRQEDVEGEIIGGNLSLLYSLIGTKGEPATKGRILFIEDVGEYYYHLDRMLTSLKLAGKLKDLSALIAGGMNKMEETSLPWGKSPQEIISDIVSDYKYPVYFNFPAGHINDNRAFYIGKKARLKTDGSLTTLSYS